MRKLAVVGVVVALAWATMAQAAEGRRRPSRATGTFVSAQLAEDVVKWELDLGEDAGKKTYEMTADVAVEYAEKEGVKEARTIRRAGGRQRPAREGRVIAKGKFTSAKLEGEKVLVTITPAEGEKPAPLVVALPKQLSVWYREADDGKLTVWGIGIPRTRRPKAK